MIRRIGLALGWAATALAALVGVCVLVFLGELAERMGCASARLLGIVCPDDKLAQSVGLLRDIGLIAAVFLPGTLALLAFAAGFAGWRLLWWMRRAQLRSS